MKATEYLKNLSEIVLQTQVDTRDDASARPVSLDDGTEKATQLILEAKDKRAKVMVIGNGGSAAIASHIQNDLCDSSRVRAIVFNEAPFLTAIANDHGYETFFETAAELWANAGDVLLAISSSGKSESILRAVKVCRSKGCRIITFSGFENDNPLRQLGDLNFYVASKAYGMVESAHALLGHYLTDATVNAQKPVEVNQKQFEVNKS